MSLALAIYLIEVFGNIGSASLTILAVYVVLAGFGIVPAIIDGDIKEYLLALYKYKWPPILLSIVAILSPSKQTMYAMFAANAGEKIMASPEMKEIGGKAFKILNDKLDELSGEKKK